MGANSYSEQIDIDNTYRLRMLISTLPPYAKDYFRGIQPHTESRTRIAYAYDLNVFFSYLHENNPIFAQKEIRDITLDDLEKLRPTDIEEYHQHYKCFDNIPIAFTDIEMIFNEESQAVDWIFRYGNEALARLEECPLDVLIGNTFGSIFPNMDSKWLRSYEHSVLYGETLEIVDYSPEVDKYLRIVCFPTFRGHCGCLLFDISETNFSVEKTVGEKAIMMYLKKLME